MKKRFGLIALLSFSSLLFAQTPPIPPAQPPPPAKELLPKLEFNYMIYIGQPASEVWNALIKKEIVDLYHLAPLQKLELKVGGNISYGTKKRELLNGTVLEVETNRKLVHTFKFIGSTDPETIVTYEILPVNKQMCSLKITHSGFKAANQTYANIQEGWPVIASSLKSIVESKTPLPWTRD